MAGTRIDGHRFVGRLPAAQLFQLAPDPRDGEDKKKFDASPDVQAMQGVRDEVQRLFEGAKRRNVPAYAQYILALHQGEDGLTPPITLYSEAELEYEEDLEAGTCRVQVPWDQKLVAIDGETQLAARHEAANIVPATKKDFVPVLIVHGKDMGFARQAFHDLNTLGVKPNSALSLSMDARDPITMVCRDVERNVPFLKDRVNKVRRQLRTSDPHILTLTALRAACVTVAKGINGVQFGNRPVPLPEADVLHIKAAAIDWWNAVAEAIGPALEDRVNKLASAPSVVAALGALGSRLVPIHDTAERRAEAKKLAETIASVDWSRKAHWEGIAGKMGAKGITAGGAKESAYAVFSALADSTQESYKRIRIAEKLAA